MLKELSSKVMKTLSSIFFKMNSSIEKKEVANIFVEEIFLKGSVYMKQNSVVPEFETMKEEEERKDEEIVRKKSTILVGKTL
jgi:UDP-N-acetylglucosamine:LPS N-acetylglucosamine transferase